jgi:hypothetical protein
MPSGKNRQGNRPSYARGPDTIDPESLPPPMRRAWERYREPDAAGHRPRAMPPISTPGFLLKSRLAPGEPR